MASLHLTTSAPQRPALAPTVAHLQADRLVLEVITLVVFCVFSVTYLGESLRWNHAVGFGLIVAASFFIFGKW